MRLLNYCNVPSWRNNIIKLTYYDETKKRANDSQIVRARESLKFKTDFVRTLNESTLLENSLNLQTEQVRKYYELLCKVMLN